MIKIMLISVVTKLLNFCLSYCEGTLMVSSSSYSSFAFFYTLAYATVLSPLTLQNRKYSLLFLKYLALLERTWLQLHNKSLSYFHFHTNQKPSRYYTTYERCCVYYFVFICLSIFRITLTYKYERIHFSFWKIALKCSPEYIYGNPSLSLPLCNCWKWSCRKGAER